MPKCEFAAHFQNNLGASLGDYFLIVRKEKQPVLKLNEMNYKQFYVCGTVLGWNCLLLFLFYLSCFFYASKVEY